MGKGGFGDAAEVVGARTGCARCALVVYVEDEGWEVALGMRFKRAWRVRCSVQCWVVL